MEDLNLDAQVEWGQEFQDVIVPLRRCKIDLEIALQDFLEAKKNPHERRLRPSEERAEERSILYYAGEDSPHDQFTPRINSAVALFEEKLRPHIKR